MLRWTERSSYPVGARQIVAFVRHVSADEPYRRPNDAVCACTGEVRSRKGSSAQLVLDLAELVCEPIEG